MFVALCLLNASFLSNESIANTEDNAACVFIALVLHYSMLASFTWFFIQALHMYLWLIRQNVTITNYMRKITVLGWAFPAPIVIAIASVGEYKTLILKTTSGKISRMCWITNPFIHYAVNIGYYALVFIFTTGIFITILTRIVQARRLRATDSKRKTFRKQLMMVLSLFLLFGLTWSVAFFSYGPMLIPSYYIFTVLNSLQGFFLFLYYYHIHNDVAGCFSDDPESTDSTKTITQSSINAVENIQGNKTACIKQPQTNFSKPEIKKDKDGFIDPADASDALDKMESLLKEMKKDNKHSASVVMGDVIGVIQRQAENAEIEDFCYSSEQNVMNVRPENDLEKGHFPWSVMIPSEAFDKASLENNESAFVEVFRFKNMGRKDETNSVLNNEVYGITMRDNIFNLTNNIEMFFTQNDQVGKASCVSWDGKGGLKWTTSGCETEQIDNNTIKCSCSHLTFFAVLMSLTDENNTELESLTFISYIGCSISMFFMAIALFMHFLLRKAKSNQATKILMNMFVALCLLNVSFLSNESVANTGDNAACVFIALVLHYSMLTSFTWFFIQALHMYLWLISQNVTITNYMRKITVLGWAFPAPIVIAIASVGEYKTLILKTSGKISLMCWITNPFIHYAVNIGYYALVFIFTTGIFITILTRIVQARCLRATDGKRKTFRKQLMMVLSLFLLFGLTWSVAFFSYGPMRIPSYYIFTVLNSLQGFFLFLYYYHIHKDLAGHFSDDPRSSGSTTTMVPPNMNGLENVYK
ncbi:adhesion G-protein coupled receptor G2-like [Sinocyclocheilus anshuiensis]|uniref:adhesion G-protein coupled receptor G2-like n=1 Tax=Sinocyclocheilus anshuiensis TaxID=1608454 RepID=UPI0007BA292F|nr:PREDICTED: adhesion G-protein coupled receptor G2-like [Sinocyclocheilus anshuiensis]